MFCIYDTERDYTVRCKEVAQPLKNKKKERKKKKQGEREEGRRRGEREGSKGACAADRRHIAVAKYFESGCFNETQSYAGGICHSSKSSSTSSNRYIKTDTFALFPFLQSQSKAGLVFGGSKKHVDDAAPPLTSLVLSLSFLL